MNSGAGCTRKSTRNKHKLGQEAVSPSYVHEDSPHLTLRFSLLQQLFSVIQEKKSRNFVTQTL